MTTTTGGDVKFSRVLTNTACHPSLAFGISKSNSGRTETLTIGGTGAAAAQLEPRWKR